jgi:dimethyl sulfoxide reductase membrane subunit
MTTKQLEKPPFGIGRFNGSWVSLIIFLLILTGLGIYSYSQQLIHGEVVTGLRNIGTMAGVSWGLYVVIYVYFMGLSFAGITLAVLIRLFNLEPLKPIARIAQVMTVVTIILGAFGVIADVGQPGRAFINLLRYARPGSPFFGTFTLVITGYLFASLVYLFLDGRRDAAVMAQIPSRLQGFCRKWASGYKDTSAERARHQRATFWLAIAIIPLLIAATSTLGMIFGLQVSRPGWFSALQAPGFVVMASLSGVGMIVIIAALLRGSEEIRERIGMQTFKWLGNLLMVLTAVYVYFMIVEWLSSYYAASNDEVLLAEALIRGDYATLFWTTVALLVIPLALLLFQYIRNSYSISLIVLSSVMVNLAAIGKRYLIVVPSQTHGTLLPYATGSYTPTLVEYGVVLGLFALGVTLYALFIKAFPILPLSHPTASDMPEATRASSARRTSVTVILVIAGFAIQAVSYFLLATPLGLPNSPAYSNPRLPFAPLIFIVGVIVVFLAAVVYELVPDKERA